MMPDPDHDDPVPVVPPDSPAWEDVTSQEHYDNELCLDTSRLPVPGGWLYRTVAGHVTEGSLGADLQGVSVTLCFVPAHRNRVVVRGTDPGHREVVIRYSTPPLPEDSPGA